MKDNYKRALNMLKGQAKRTMDPDLDTYMKLSPDAIQALREHYGDEQVEQYVKDMEGRRAKTNR
jgi:Holliday junction resolvase RusA-like endonuclease